MVIRLDEREIFTGSITTPAQAIF